MVDTVIVDINTRRLRTAARRLPISRVGTLVAAVAVAVVAFATPAAAHVRSEGTPAQGGYGIVNLIVPGESDTAKTVGLTVTFPEDVNLTSARTLPVPGWTATVERKQAGGSERVSRIVWTATDPANGYGSAEYRQFSFSAGPWPKDVSSVALPADQQYNDGSVVSWNEVAVDHASEPEHPAPVVTLTSTSDGHGQVSSHGAANASSDEDAAASSSHGTSETSSDWLWHTLSIASLVLALAAVAAVAFVLRRGRVTGS